MLYSLFLIVRKIKQQQNKSEFLFYNIWIALIGGWLSHCRTYFPILGRLVKCRFFLIFYSRHLVFRKPTAISCWFSGICRYELHMFFILDKYRYWKVYILSFNIDTSINESLNINLLTISSTNHMLKRNVSFYHS